jgi:hypothetical protein
MSTPYDPRNMEWDYWCALTSEQFAAQQLGTVSEDRWREWADAFGGIGYFNNSGVPDSRNFGTWQDWAFAFLNAMSLKT